VRLAVAVLVMLSCAATGAAAQPYPSKMVRIVVGFPRGSDADIIARVIGAKLYETVGRQFETENRPGAESNIAAEEVAKSSPDGYTLFLGTAANAINATLYSRLPFDFARDFSPIVLTNAVPDLLFAHASIPARSVKELIALAKARPGQVKFASPGAGTAPHLSGELFKVMAGINLSHVPYKGNLPAVAALLAGEVDVMFSQPALVLPHVQEKRLQALAITTSERMASLPGVPTVSESGLAGYESRAWFGFVAPAQTPAAVIARLNTEIGKVLTLPDIRNQFELQGIEILGGSPDRFGDYIRSEIAKWAKAVRLSGAKAD
jgi:tripartite-type tricarboxylate transporter receptor subunit TctC